MNPPFTYAEYALEKYLKNWDSSWLHVYDAGLDESCNCYRSIYNFPRIGKQAHGETDKALLDIQSQFPLGMDVIEARLRNEIGNLK